MNNQKRNWDQFEESKDFEESNLLKIGTQDLIGKFKSKQDLYSYFTEVLGYYLPPFEGVNRDYLRQILKGDKKLLKMNEVKLIKVPKYDELSVKELLKMIKDDQDILGYFPDINEKAKPIDRTYFFNVLNTLQSEYLLHIIKQSQDKRNNPQSDQNKKDYILISEEWMSQLTSHPFVSRKNGRTIQLLKQSAKIFKARKPQQQNNNVLSLKRFKGLEGINNSAFKQNQHLTQMTLQPNSFPEDQSNFNEKIQQINRFNI